jgi:D-glycerate 3-kinase
VHAIARRRAALGRPIAVGLAGAQGSGKTTMAKRLGTMLHSEGLLAVALSLDDFYLPRAEREKLANEVNPLLITRGVPGTHDMRLLGAALEALLAGRSARVPCFDKASDDRTGTVEVGPPADIVLVEGWCIGARPQPAGALAHPVNALERAEDPDGRWRRWVNARLDSDYAEIWRKLDLRLFLRAPSFDVVADWRGEQEAELGARAMTPAQLARFVAHYERITRWMIEDCPADLTISLDASRRPID